MKARTLLASLLAFAAVAVPAHAEDGVWKVGTGYVIRFEKLDLARPLDRQILLAQVERTAEKACAGLRPAARRKACTADTVRSVERAASPTLSAALDAARFERDGIMQAQMQAQR